MSGNHKRPIFYGAALAVFTPWLIFMSIILFDFVMDGRSIDLFSMTLMSVIALPVSFIASFVFGAPMIVFLRRRCWLSVTTVLIAGFTVGAVAAFLLLASIGGIDSDQEIWPTFLFGGALGFISGIAFLHWHWPDALHLNHASCTLKTTKLFVSTCREIHTADGQGPIRMKPSFHTRIQIAKVFKTLFPGS